MIVPLIGITRCLLQTNYRPSNFNKNHFAQIVLTSNRLISSNNKRYLSLTEKLKQFLPLVKSGSWLIILSKELRQFTLLKFNAVNVFKNCVAQCEFVLAHRIRRGQQIVSLYTRLWDEWALKQFVNRIRKQFVRRGKEFFLGAATVSAFNWDQERIPESQLNSHLHEFTLCYNLKREGSVCSEEPTTCPACNGDGQYEVREHTCWEPFIQDRDIVVWKMEEHHRKGSGLYCYKMFGRYDDVTANDFMQVFLDLEDRSSWDVHAVKFYIVDSEPSTNSEVIYWESKWPKLFSNRDYVYKRRYKIDRAKKMMVIVNKSTEHPSVPIYQSKTRVSEFWSYMVIRPIVDFDEPGIEFSLTYFDNPGIVLPSSISNWVSAHGMPDYLNKLHLAALNLRHRRKKIAVESKEEEEKVDPPSSGGTYSSGDDPFESVFTYIHWARSFLF